MCGHDGCDLYVSNAASLTSGADHPSFRFYWKNCSHMVRNVLEAIHEWPGFSLIPMTPLQVKRHVQRLGVEMTWAAYLDFLASRGSVPVGSQRRVLMQGFMKRSASMGSTQGLSRHGGGQHAAANNLFWLRQVFTQHPNTPPTPQGIF